MNDWKLGRASTWRLSFLAERQVVLSWPVCIHRNEQIRHRANSCSKTGRFCPKHFFPTRQQKRLLNLGQPSSTPPSLGVGRRFYRTGAGPSRWKAATLVTATESTSKALANARKPMFALRIFCRLWSVSLFPSKVPTLFGERNGFHFFRRKRQILASFDLDDEAFAGNC